MRRHYAHTEQQSSGNEHDHDSKSEDIGPAWADQISHDFAVVHQHVEKQQRWRHCQNRNHIHHQHDIDERNAWDENKRCGRGRFENQDKIERFSLLERQIQAVRPVRDLSDTAERVRATRDLSQRIRVDGSDELSRLAATFNGMLESLDEAAHQQRRLVQDASHELRTPLTSLRTNIELLATRGDELRPDDREQLLRDVIEQTGEMTVLIGELTQLAHGEQQAPTQEEVRLDLVTQEAIRRTTRNHPTVPIVAKLDPTTVVGVPANLERAIGNLLDNAAKWSPVGSEVDVALSGDELTVRDRGPGIAEHDLPHVFERFYRATNARGMPGSGLGLAIVRQVAEAHGGTVTAEAAPGGGTLIRMRFAAGNGSTPG